MFVVALPPTRVLSSANITPDAAHAFLSCFIAKADADRHTSARGDLVLADQRRIEQALQGVFIPKPVEVFPVSEPTPKKQKWVQQEHEQGGYEIPSMEDGTGDVALDKEPAMEGTVDKEQRKALKKARMAEERKQRAKEKARERQ